MWQIGCTWLLSLVSKMLRQCAFCLDFPPGQSVHGAVFTTEPGRPMPNKCRLSKKQQSALDQITILPSLSMSELRALWREHFNCDPFSTHPEVLIPCLAYRIQEQVYGVLSKTTRTRLVEIGRDVDAGRQPAYAIAPRIKPGTRLIRSWHGDVHEVTVVDGGYLYRQTTYASLSEIARLITGSRWSGPVFFGLKVKSVASDDAGPPSASQTRLGKAAASFNMEAAHD